MNIPFQWIGVVYKKKFGIKWPTRVDKSLNTNQPTGIVVLVRVPSMCQIDLFENLIELLDFI